MLCKLMQHGFRVPDGWVLPVEVLLELLTECDQTPKQITRFINDIELPAPLVDTLSQLCTGEQLWVVRSSALGEDGKQCSFAGQLESVLHVKTIEQMCRAIKTVWASAWSETALSYQQIHNQRLDGVAVLIQHQLDAQQAGVLFTRHPITGAADVVIEWVDGLADKLVQGEVTPARLTTPLTSKPTTPTFASKLLTVANQTERRFGPGQDIEWVWTTDQQLYLVQQRPMTTPIERHTGLVDGQRAMVWSNANMAENYPTPITPLLYSIAQRGYTNYFANLGEAFGITPKRIAAMTQPLQYMTGVHRGHLYYNLSHVHACLLAAPFGTRLIQDWDGFLGVEAGAQATRNEQAPPLTQLFEALRMIAHTSHAMLNIEAGLVRFEARVDDFARRYHHQHHEGMPPDALLSGLRDFMTIRERDWVDASMTDAATTLSLGVLKQALTHLDQNTQLSALLDGIDNLISAEPIRRMWQLASALHANPTLKALLHDPPAFIHARDDHPQWFGMFDRYLDEMGFRVSGELMLTTPSLQETPEVVVALLSHYVDTPNPDRHKTTSKQKHQRARHAIFTAATKRHGRIIGSTLASIIGRVVDRVHQAISYRERARFKQALLYYRLRRLALSIGARFVQAGWLETNTDIFYLRVEEIDALLAGHALYPEATATTIQARKQAHQTAQNIRAPRVVKLTTGAYWQPGQNQPEAPADDTECTIASPGMVTATARVLQHVHEHAKLNAGDILVTQQTDPGWGPLFYTASGLILERGGLLSHGAILARELGIPALVGVQKATQNLDGCTVTLDAQRGRIIHQPEEV